MSCYESRLIIPSTIAAVCENAREGQYQYDWSSTQKRVVSATETRSRKNKEINVFTPTDGGSRYKDAVNQVPVHEYKIWLKLVYASVNHQPSAAFLNIWLLAQYVSQATKTQERTVSKIKQIIPYAIGDTMLEIKGVAREYTQVDIAKLNNITIKNWENNWSSRFKHLKRICHRLDRDSLIACEYQFERFFKKSA
ncbi:hypothetical protein KUL42_32670 [Alteromonas sp. KUL42]|uniref:bacteriophage antitermination protein Q n=1 Tax=Alteromonas sp. KUL42 TaxID=2480797 RepID=UPI0010FFC722|nr:bacteriophage antitermination protein Q [Alteromonas sp. KUL42]GEA08506.1 hypothetical protein KUL42_32670 [Alteromonas sp. KUL42]